MLKKILVVAVLACPTGIYAKDSVDYVPAPAWVESYPAEYAGDYTGGPSVVLYNDTQVRVLDGAVATHNAFKVQLKTPEALALGNLNLIWAPDSSEIAVHHLRVHRDGEIIDVLADYKFDTFQREGGLERSMLDGLLTANLQIPGLRVGDTVEFASTIVQRDLTFGETSFGNLALAPELPPGNYKLTLSWEPGEDPRWQPTPDIREKVVVGDRRVGLTLDNPGPLVAPAMAPVRYYLGRAIEFTEFASWEEVSARSFSMYEDAAEIGDLPSLQRKIADIAEQHDNPADRAQAALALVQDDVRYVYTGMAGGNFTPASAADTWERRFGDCKGKTALLMGILNELGIEAEAVLVNLNGGDGLQWLLPNPGNFDHVLVRAELGGEDYWLDGTRQGDGRLIPVAESPLRWVLPLSNHGSRLEEIDYVPPRMPTSVEYMDIDARGGIEGATPVVMTNILSGDAAYGMNQALKSQPKSVIVDGLRRQFQQGWASVDEVDWEYDQAHGTLALKISGTLDLEWDYSESERRGEGGHLFLPGGGFYPPDEKKRPDDQDQSAPYANDPLLFKCSATRVRLPEMGENSWVIAARTVDQTIGGVHYYRIANLEDRTVSLVRSSRTVAAEVSPESAAKTNALIEDFDNEKASVATVYDQPEDEYQVADDRIPDFSDVDWLTNPYPCLPPKEW